MEDKTEMQPGQQLQYGHHTTIILNSKHPHFRFEILSHPVVCMKFIIIMWGDQREPGRKGKNAFIYSVKWITLIWFCYLSVDVSAGLVPMKSLHCISNSTEHEVDHLHREHSVIRKLMTWRVHYNFHSHSIGAVRVCYSRISASASTHIFLCCCSQHEWTLTLNF